MKIENSKVEEWIRKSDVARFYRESFPDIGMGEIRFSKNDIICNLDNIESRNMLEAKVTFDRNFAEDVAEEVLDEFEYKGKTIREWAEIITEKMEGVWHLSAENEWTCSGCGWSIGLADKATPLDIECYYCPGCGLRMTVEEDK